MASTLSVTITYTTQRDLSKQQLNIVSVDSFQIEGKGKKLKEQLKDQLSKIKEGKGKPAMKLRRIWRVLEANGFQLSSRQRLKGFTLAEEVWERADDDTKPAA